MFKIMVGLASPHESKEPKTFFVQQAPDFSSFKQYIRSKAELQSELRKIGFPKVTLEGIVELYGKHNKVLADSVLPWIDVNELYEIREYDRDKFEGNWNGKKTRKEYQEQEDYIAKNGFSEDDFGIVHLSRIGDTLIKAQLGEGNHRVIIAKRKGSPKTMPVLIQYGSFL